MPIELYFLKMLLFTIYFIKKITNKELFDTTPSTTDYSNHFYVCFMFCIPKQSDHWS